jgi:hypothetical protein
MIGQGGLHSRLGPVRSFHLLAGPPKNQRLLILIHLPLNREVFDAPRSDFPRSPRSIAKHLGRESS